MSNKSTDSIITNKPGSNPQVLRARNLVDEYYGPVFQLANALLNDKLSANQVAVKILASALTQIEEYQGKKNKKLWFFSLTLDETKKAEHKQKLKQRQFTDAPTDQLNFWKFVASLETREFKLAILHYLCALSVEQAADLLNVSQQAVKTQLEIFKRDFQIILQSESHKKGENERIDSGVLNPLELVGILSSRFQARWPIPQLSSKEKKATNQQILYQFADQTIQQGRTFYKRVLTLIGFATLAVICLIGGITAYVIIPRTSWGSSANDDAAQGQPTPITPAPNPKPLSRISSTEEILDRMDESTSNWKTLWLDAQFTIYGPKSYIGPHKTYRTQIWINQPDESLEFFGMLVDDPNSLYLVKDGNILYMNPLLEKTVTEEWNGEIETLLQNKELKQMVFPHILGLTNQEGSIESKRIEEIAGRRALAFDWIKFQSERQYRFWIDVTTGLVLRMQEFEPTNPARPLSETVVTEISYNQNYPIRNLAASFQLDETISYGIQTPAADMLFPTPTSALLPTRQPTLAPVEAPPFFDPANGYLNYQFSRRPEIAYIQEKTASVPAELFSDDYLLGNLEFGLPWALQCTRSPDGKRLAFNTKTDGTTLPDDELRWFNIEDPGSIYQPMPDLHALDFAFSPDNYKLAVYGLGDGEMDNGIYIVNIGTGEYELLINLEHAESLVWSPDGDYLAYISADTISADRAIYIIHTHTGLITHRILYDLYTEMTPADQPISSWGVRFPVEMGGMEECSLPPGQ